MQRIIPIALAIILGGPALSVPSAAQARDAERLQVETISAMPAQGRDADIVDRLAGIICIEGNSDASEHDKVMKRELGVTPLRDPAIASYMVEFLRCTDQTPERWRANWIDPQIHYASVFMQNFSKDMKCEDGGLIWRPNRIMRVVATFKYFRYNGRPYEVQPLPIRFPCESNGYAIGEGRKLGNSIQYRFHGNRGPTLRIKLKAVLSWTTGTRNWISTWDLRWR